MDEKTKNEFIHEFMILSAKLAANPRDNPFNAVTDLGKFFDKIWEDGYCAGLKLDNLIKNFGK